MERVKTNIERKSRIEGDRIIIDSVVSEDMATEQFFETHAQKLQQLGNLQQQLVGVKAQMKQREGKIDTTEDEMKELMILKEKITKIKDMDKYDTLKTSAQTLEIDINRIQKETIVFQETVKQLEEIKTKTGEENGPMGND